MPTDDSMVQEDRTADESSLYRALEEAEGRDPDDGTLIDNRQEGIQAQDEYDMEEQEPDGAMKKKALLIFLPVALVIVGIFLLYSFEVISLLTINIIMGAIIVIAGIGYMAVRKR